MRRTTLPAFGLGLVVVLMTVFLVGRAAGSDPAAIRSPSGRRRQPPGPDRSPTPPIRAGLGTCPGRSARGVK